MTVPKKLIEEVRETLTFLSDFPGAFAALVSLEAILDEVGGLAKKWEKLADDGLDYGEFDAGFQNATAAHAAELRAAIDEEGTARR